MQSNSKSIKKKAALAALLLFPILFVLILGKVQWVHQELPYLGETIQNPDGTKTYHTVGDFVLYNQHGKKITFDDFDSCILLVNIFFASCPEVCPQMNKQIQSVAEGYVREPKIQFLTVTIDPEHDSVSVLADYAKAYQADIYKRTFATGNKKEIYDWVMNDLLLANEQRGADFIHDDKVVIIDKAHHIRSILPTRAPTNPQRLECIKHIKDDIENLKYEYRKKAMD